MNLSLKYQRFTPSGSKDIGIRILEFVTKTQFLILRNGGDTQRRLSKRQLYNRRS